ncbi:hypothetical protein AcW1_009179 [Taiwanofungus camphoratus]|nr:hypothetical protein AcW1_009179 [Antrodia cinnamomea]KAI0958555.1 hypothetical protein AcV7_004346 [Antrodia cinnamomea]
MVINMHRVNKLRLLDRKEEIPNGSAITVFFTVNIRKQSDGRNVVGMNLQRVILIARPETSASESRRYKDKEDAIHPGVNPESELSKEDDDQGADESEGRAHVI